ncbi:MAG: class II fructose-bisphosphate aldolase, partial [Actinomycetota bacterium]
MPIVDPERYRTMLRAAADGGWAVPSVNVTSSTTANAVLAGLAAAESDGIIGIGLGGARFAAGRPGDEALGAEALAAFVHVVADRYPINVAIHTDHCPPDRWDAVVGPLLAVTRARVAAGQLPLFQSHMFDGSHLPLAHNLARSVALRDELAALGVVLELEIGLVGGEEDGIDNRDVAAERMYTTPGDMVAVVDALGPGDDSLVAAAFGNIHGIEPRADVVLDPEVLARGQDAIARAHGPDARLLLVFHGGSGAAPSDVRQAVANGVVKMNVDTDTQYAYTAAVVERLATDRDRVLGGRGRPADKTAFEQRAWMAHGEAAMADRVVEACRVLGSGGPAHGPPAGGPAGPGPEAVGGGAGGAGGP